MPNVGPRYRGNRDYLLELEVRLTSVHGSRDLFISLFIAAIISFACYKQKKDDKFLWEPYEH